MQILQGDISSIEAYSAVYDLLKENGFLPPNIEGDFCDYLQHCDDFEAVAYFCVNYDTVLCADSINGDLFSVCSADEFINGIYKQYKEFDY